jgi:Domain of unknown function (DUF4437)
MSRLLRTGAVMLAVGHLAISGTRVTLAHGDQAGKPAAADEKKASPQAKKMAAGGHVMVDANQLKWGPAPPGLPAGAEIAVLDGDPSKPGPFSLRAKLPDGYTVAPHWHPTTENLLVVSGTLMVGTGDTFQEGSMHALTAGGYSKMPAKTNHYVRAKGETIFQLYGNGPFSITYVNPKDDPRKTKKTTP